MRVIVSISDCWEGDPMSPFVGEFIVKIVGSQISFSLSVVCRYLSERQMGGLPWTRCIDSLEYWPVCWHLRHIPSTSPFLVIPRWFRVLPLLVHSANHSPQCSHWAYWHQFELWRFFAIMTSGSSPDTICSCPDFRHCVKAKQYSLLGRLWVESAAQKITKSSVELICWADKR